MVSIPARFATRLSLYQKKQLLEEQKSDFTNAHFRKSVSSFRTLRAPNMPSFDFPGDFDP